MIQKQKQEQTPSSLKLKPETHLASHQPDDFQLEMRCDQVIQHSDFPSNLKSDINNKDQQQCTCICARCMNNNKKIISDPNDPLEKKKQKRRQYKKRQKIKLQQKKQQALKQLQQIIQNIYQLKTNFTDERQKIEECLRNIQKNQDRFYDFINFVIRQQVDAIRKQIRTCLSALTEKEPNFAKIPKLYEQFDKVRHASPQVEKIINLFIKKALENNGQIISPHKNLDRMTFKFLILNDAQNRNNFVKVVHTIVREDVKYQRQKQLIKQMISMIKQKDLLAEDSEDEQDEINNQSQEDDDNNNEQNQTVTQKTTKQSEKDFQEDSQFEDDDNQANKQNTNKPRKKPKKKKKSKKQFQNNFQIIYQRTSKMMIQKQRYACNVEEEWLQRIKQKYLQQKSKAKIKNTTVTIT